MKELSLGIDTSNYKTSVALIDASDNIIYDGRIPLKTPKGGRGLRQQEALFQHIENLPLLIEEAFRMARNCSIEAIAASSAPRAVEGSYMPCFNGGRSAAEMIGAVLNLEAKFFSHQEGHIEAGRRYTDLREKSRFGAFHFSGGTTEVLIYDEGKLNIVGGTMDISFGQVIDRIGVMLGMDFPAGEELDGIALSADEYIKFKKVKIKDGFFNLSGLETQAKRAIEDGGEASKTIKGIMISISDVIIETTGYMKEKYDIEDFLFVGGVSSSQFIRRNIMERTNNAYFSRPELSSDNGVGIALLGGNELWH